MRGSTLANEIRFELAGDATSLTRAMDSAGAGAKEMADDFTSAGREAGRFSGGVSSLNEKIDSSESKFMGAADLVDGLAGAFGISLGPTVEYARAFGDMAGGFTATLGPAMESISGKLGKLSAVTKVQTAAQTALNTVMRANPILLAVTAVAALVAIFVVAYKKSETFRAIVDGAMAGVKKALSSVGDRAEWLKDKIVGVVESAAQKLGTVADIITTPYQLAFKAIASLWNSTVGKLRVSIPGFMGFGGISFDVPDIPTFADGGVARGGQPAIVGERGPELFIPGQTGTVVPNHALGSNVTIVIGSPGDPFTEAIRKTVRLIGGGDVQKAFGS